MKKSDNGLSRREFMTAAGAAAVAASTAGAAGAAEPKRGGEAKVGVPVLPNGQDPGRYVGLYAQQALAYSHDGLVDLTPPRVIMDLLEKGTPDDEIPVVVPNLAESWEISKDGKSYTFHLQKGVHFHNGKELKSEDVDYCIRRVLSKPIGSSSYSKFQTVESVKIHDDHTFTINIKEPMSPFISFCNMALPIYPKDSLPMDALQKKVDKDNPPAPGTGPFKWVDWKPGSWIRWERFDGYRLPGKPYLDAVTSIRASEDTVRYTALRTGELDYAGGISDAVVSSLLKDSQKKTFVKIEKEGYIVHVLGYGLVQSLALNMSQPPFNDIRVRKALSLALNRAQLALGSTYGLGEPGWQHYSKEQTPFWIDGLDWYEEDVAEARRLLKEAGYEKGLVIEFLAQPTNMNMTKAAEIMQQHLKRVGIQLKIKLLQRAGFFPLKRTHKYQMITNSNGQYYTFDPDTMYDNIYSFSKTNNWRNQAEYNSDEADRLLDQARIAQSLAERKALYKRLFEVMKKDIPYIPMFSQQPSVGVSSNLKGYDPLAMIPDMRIFREVWKG